MTKCYLLALVKCPPEFSEYQRDICTYNFAINCTWEYVGWIKIFTISCGSGVQTRVHVLRVPSPQSLGLVAESWRQLRCVQSGVWAAVWPCTGGSAAQWSFGVQGAPLTTATWGASSFVDKEAMSFRKHRAFELESVCFEKQRVREVGRHHVKRGFCFSPAIIGSI